jgi:hypothetical protein
MSAHDVAMVAAVRAAPLADDVIRLAPNVISVRHWDRLLGGLLYAVSPRVGAGRAFCGAVFRWTSWSARSVTVGYG